MNTTTKPLFEETLNIVFECLDKYKNAQPLLPIECLKNYQLIYNEDDDQTITRDDNQVVIERLSLRYAIKETPSRASAHRSLPRVNITRATTSNPSDSSDSLPSLENNNENSSPRIITPFISTSMQPISDVIETIEPLKHQDDIELERLIRSKSAKCKNSVVTFINICQSTNCSNSSTQYETCSINNKYIDITSKETN